MTRHAARPRAALASLALFALCLLAAPGRCEAQTRPRSFQLRALGVLGGDVDTNLSCYLLGRRDEPPQVMIDGGSVAAGIIKWKEDAGELARDASWSARTQTVAAALKPVQAALVTHAHLDHVGGLIQKTTLDLLLAFQGRPSLEVIGLPVTIDALRDFAFKPPLWVDFTKIPANNPAVKLSALEAGSWRKAGPFEVQAIPVNHPDGGAAFLFLAGDEAYLHVGDTGRCPSLWKVVRPLFRGGRLHAITIEVSWPSAQEKLAVQTGHLTPASLLLELADLAGEPGERPSADALTPDQARRLAADLAPRFSACPIVITHIKAADYDKAVAELDALKAQGLNLIVPQQGRAYEF